MEPAAARFIRNGSAPEYVSKVQDGHSPVEERIYQALWAASDRSTGLISIGWDQMARISGLGKNWKTAKTNCLRLIEKLALVKVDNHDSSIRKGTTYRVLSFAEIRQRRLQAGLVWVVRNRGGVRFVAAPSPPTVGLEPTVGSEGTVRSEPTATVGSHAPLTVGSEPTPLDSAQTETPDTTRPVEPADLAVLRRGFERLMLPFDDDAGRRLIRDCRALQPSAEVDEILVAVQIRWGYQGARINPDNPIGWLIAHVPGYLKGGGLDAVREMLGKGSQQPALEPPAAARALRRP